MIGLSAEMKLNSFGVPPPVLEKIVPYVSYATMCLIFIAFDLTQHGCFRNQKRFIAMYRKRAPQYLEFDLVLGVD